MTRFACAPTSAVVYSDWCDHCGEFDAPASKARGASRVCVS